MCETYLMKLHIIMKHLFTHKSSQSLCVGLSILEVETQVKRVCREQSSDDYFISQGNLTPSPFYSTYSKLVVFRFPVPLSCNSIHSSSILLQSLCTCCPNRASGAQSTTVQWTAAPGCAWRCACAECSSDRPHSVLFASLNCAANHNSGYIVLSVF